MAAGFPQARSTRELFRWRIRQRLAVSCPQSGVAARVAGTACMFKAGWCAVYLEPARSQRGRLEPRALWHVSRFRDLAPLCIVGGLRRTDPLLPSRWLAAGKAAVARKHMATVSAGRRARRQGSEA